MCDHCGCRAYPRIAELTAEHEEILTLAWVLAEAERAGEPLPAEELAALTRMLDIHVVKEETGLYPELVHRQDLSASQLAELETEHEEIHQTLILAHFGRREYYALAAHIEVEESELFPSAMFGFEDEDWEALDVAFRAADAMLVQPAQPAHHGSSTVPL